MAARGIYGQIGAALLDVVAPLLDALEDEVSFRGLMRRHGWEPPRDEGFLSGIRPLCDIGAEVQGLVAAIDDLSTPGDGLGDAARVVDHCRALSTRLRAIGAGARPPGLPFPLSEDAFWESF